MGFFRKLFTFSSVTYQMQYLGSLSQRQVEFIFSSPHNKVRIICDLSSFDEKVILIPYFAPQAGKMLELGYGINDFVTDIKNMLMALEVATKGEDFLYEAFEIFLKKHVNEFHRIIDADLFRIVGEFMLVVRALSLQKGINLSISDKIEIAQSLINRVMQGHFAQYLYLTRYRRNGLKLEPYLEKYL